LPDSHCHFLSTLSRKWEKWFCHLHNERFPLWSTAKAFFHGGLLTWVMLLSFHNPKVFFGPNGEIYTSN
ncbi:hypothetical protein QQP08_024454, partial [Theobroma cacao]